MAKIIVIANQKGGVAKTTTAAALVAGLGRKFKVLGIDMDSQGNLGKGLGINTEIEDTVYPLLSDATKDVHKVIQQTKYYDIIPSNFMLANAERELLSTVDSQFKLKNNVIKKVKDEYDYIVIDTPPSLSLLTLNAMIAADEVIIPTTAEKFGVEAIYQLHRTILSPLVNTELNKNLKVAGILITKYNARVNVSKGYKEAAELLGKQLNMSVFNTVIRTGVAISEAQSQGIDLFEYNENFKHKKSKVATDYSKFLQEFMKKTYGIDFIL